MWRGVSLLTREGAVPPPQKKIMDFKWANFGTNSNSSPKAGIAFLGTPFPLSK